MIPQAASARISARGQPTGLRPRAAPPCAACGWLHYRRAFKCAAGVLSKANQGTCYITCGRHMPLPPQSARKSAPGAALVRPDAPAGLRCTACARQGPWRRSSPAWPAAFRPAKPYPKPGRVRPGALRARGGARGGGAARRGRRLSGRPCPALVGGRGGGDAAAGGRARRALLAVGAHAAARAAQAGAHACPGTHPGSGAAGARCAPCCAKRRAQLCGRGPPAWLPARRACAVSQTARVADNSEQGSLGRPLCVQDLHE